jgi:hypothetical protein
MRIDYTLPALQPGTPPDDPSTLEEGGSPSFRELVRGEPVQLPETLDQQLRLDTRPFTGTYVGPPPRPRSMELYDAESQRSRWNSMLWRHGASGAVGMTASSPSVRSMLDMLQQMRQMEDSIISQSVAVTRG